MGNQAGHLNRIIIMNPSNVLLASVAASDEAAIGVLLERLSENWRLGDAVAYAAAFTEDADYIAFDGSHAKGRDEIARMHRDLFAFFNRVFQGSRLVTEKSSMRFLGPDTVLMHATGAVLFPGQKVMSADRRSINTSVIARQPDGTWLIAAFQNTRVRIRPLPTGRALGVLAFMMRMRMALGRS